MFVHRKVKNHTPSTLFSFRLSKRYFFRSPERSSMVTGGDRLSWKGFISIRCLNAHLDSETRLPRPYHYKDKDLVVKGFEPQTLSTHVKRPNRLATALANFICLLRAFYALPSFFFFFENRNIVVTLGILEQFWCIVMQIERSTVSKQCLNADLQSSCYFFAERERDTLHCVSGRLWLNINHFLCHRDASARMLDENNEGLCRKFQKFLEIFTSFSEKKRKRHLAQCVDKSVSCMGKAMAK